MVARIEVEVEGTGEAKRRLDAFAAAVADLRPFFEAEGEVFRERTDRQFRSEGALLGGWAALVPWYEAYKERVRPGRRILVFDGDLRRSMVEPGAEHNINRIGPRRAAFGSDDFKAQFHEYGTRKMPRRQMIVWRSSDRAEMEERLAAYLQEAAG